MNGASNLRLHPWRDSVEHCLRLLEAPLSLSPTSVVTTKEPIVSSVRRGQYTHATYPGSSPAGGSTRNVNVLIRSVDICFHETDYQAGVSNKMNLVELFEAIARLPSLESLIVRLTTTPSTFPLCQKGIPPISALNAVLASSPQLGYLTLIGLPLFADDFDMNGWAELLRIHPTLHSIVIKDSMFAAPHHLDQLKSAMKHRKHVEYLNNQVIDVSQLPQDDIKPWYQSLFSVCLFSCMLLLLSSLVWTILKNFNGAPSVLRSIEIPVQSPLSYFGLQKPSIAPKKVVWWKRLFRRPHNHH